jgi:probable HAF family extracellular repeat protein
MKARLLVVGVAAFAAPWARAGTDPFSVVGVGDLPGGATVSQASAISRDGQVVVGYSYGSNPDGFGEAIRWTRASGIVGGMGALPGARIHSGADGVSGDGSVIVGFAEGSSGSNFASRWTAASGQTLLPGVTGFQSSGRALAVNADGNIAVGSVGGTSSTEQAVRWVGAVPSGLGDLPGGPIASRALAVSDDGMVVVGFGSPSSTVHRSFRWTQATGMVDLGLLPGTPTGASSACEAISGNGLICFGSQGVSGSDARAFRWDTANGLQAMSGPTGATATNIYGSSFNGDVLVGEARWQSLPENRPVIWINGEAFELSQYLAANGADMSGWLLDTATSVSSDGLTICGYGEHNGNVEGFVATIPAPSGLMLLLAAAVPMRRARVRVRN